MANGWVMEDVDEARVHHQRTRTSSRYLCRSFKIWRCSGSCLLSSAGNSLGSS